ncbi:hypothetical protein [Streptomyces sp. NPDC048425]|uniref:hypothetical protein n=1 Tax=Streptomyces sp. NPDC048425 TaxID=3365548 RepID=UPI0037247CB0
MSIITAATRLFGAGIGITGTLLSERWRARISADQEQRAAYLLLREERKDVLIRFFALVREVERVAGRQHARDEVSDDEAAELTSLGRVLQTHLVARTTRRSGKRLAGQGPALV